MTRRTDRLASLLRQTIGEIVLQRISDPRIDPALVTITRVEVSDDTARAKVFFSAMGEDATQRKVQAALQHAAGRIQELMMRQITLRNTPVLTFELDVKYKKTLQTLALIQSAMEEIRCNEDDDVDGRDPGEVAAPEDEVESDS